MKNIMAAGSSALPDAGWEWQAPNGRGLSTA
jgi:hypothetical protein